MVDVMSTVAYRSHGMAPSGMPVRTHLRPTRSTRGQNVSKPSHRAEIAVADWRKSTFSGSSSTCCVEVAMLAGGQVAVRDSKDPSGPALIFTQGEWEAFRRGVCAGEFQLP